MRPSPHRPPPDAVCDSPSKIDLAATHEILGLAAAGRYGLSPAFVLFTTDLTAHALVDLARTKRLEELEQAWKRALEAPGPIEPLCAAISALCDADMASRALSLTTEMVAALSDIERVADARALAALSVRRGAANEELTQRLLDLTERAFAGEPWFPVFKERSGLGSNLALATFKAFEDLVRYTAGRAVYHPGGWGEGVVESFNATTMEVTVKLANGRVLELPFDSLLDTFRPLDDDDLRAMRLTAIDALREEAEKTPSVLIRRAARMMRGQIPSTKLKEVLSPSVIPTSKWSAFWKRARSAATVDPWLQIEGSANRPTFVLRARPLSLPDEAKRAMSFADNLAMALGTCRDFLSRCDDPAAREALLDLAQERVTATYASAQPADLAHLVDGLLLLEANNRQIANASAAQELRKLILDDAGDFQPQGLDKVQAQEEAVQALPAALGPDWADLVIPTLLSVPITVVENIGDLLEQHGHAPRLLDLWNQVAPFPRRHPAMTYLLGRMYAAGHFDAAADRPTPIAVGRVLLHLTRVLAADKRGNPTLGRVLARAASLLAGRKSFLAGVLETIDRENLRDYLGITERGGDDFPIDVISLVLRTVSRRFPDLTAAPEKPFWMEDYIYVTAAGLARQREEYRKLVDEKIPTNSTAIGAAASLGDLSENSEWESAMEEQRNLTTRATGMDTELRKARVIEDQDIPEDCVAPGTRVTFTHEATGQQESWRVLGPWDAVADDILSYRAPMAKDLLGKSVGDTATIQGPTGPATVRIDAIEKIV